MAGSATQPGKTRTRGGSMTIAFSTRALQRALWAGAAVVILLGILRELYVAGFGTDGPLRDLRHVSLNAEHCLGAWFGSTQMLVASLLCAIHAACARSAPNSAQGEAPWPRYVPFFWGLLAVVMLALSIDEAVSFHETLITILKSAGEISPLFHFGWVLVAAPLVVAFAVLSLPFLAALPRGVALRIMLGGAIFVSGALVFEMVDGAILVAYGEASWQYVTGFVLEDALEMAGMNVFIGALLDHLVKKVGAFEGTLGLRLAPQAA